VEDAGVGLGVPGNDVVCAGVLVVGRADDAGVFFEVSALLLSSALLDVSIVEKRIVVAVVSTTVDCGDEDVAVVVWEGDVACVAVDVFSVILVKVFILVLRSVVLLRVEVEVVARVELAIAVFFSDVSAAVLFHICSAVVLLESVKILMDKLFH